jgi:hypothetical protein
LYCRIIGLSVREVEEDMGEGGFVSYPKIDLAQVGKMKYNVANIVMNTSHLNVMNSISILFLSIWNSLL